MDENSDWLWKMRNLFETLNEKFSKFYSPSEHLAVDEVINYKGRVIFQHYVPKVHKCFGIKIYKLCDETGYLYNMTVYLSRDRQWTVQHLTATRVIVSELTKKIQGRGHTNCIWTITSPPQTYSMTWTRNKFTVVTLSGPTGRACHRIRPPREWHSIEVAFRYRLGWINSNTVEGQMWHMYFDKHPWCTSRG